MRYDKPVIVLLFIVFTCCTRLLAQQPVSPALPQTPGTTTDTGSLVKLLKADKYRLIKKDTTGDLNILVGHVQMLQNKTWFNCDSAVYNNKTNMVEAFGNVHINDNDSVHTYSQYLKYLGNTRVAYLSKNVSLTDGKGTLTTENLEYDLNAKIGTYKTGGKLVNGSTVLTSNEGYYYADTREAYFKDHVKLVDPEYTVATDTLLYNVDSETATFVAATTINDGVSTIRTRSGYYDLKNGLANFGNRPIIEDSTQQIIADNVNYDKKTGLGHAEGNVIYRDTSQGVTIFSGDSKINNNTKQILATKKPVMILKQDKDSLFVSADTLFSSMRPDTLSLHQGADSLKNDSLKQVTVIDTKKASDSIRYFEAFRHVRIFSDSLQGVCDSLAYSSKDSIFRMYTDPVLWAKESQVMGDTIFLLTKNKKADQVLVFENGFSINRTKEAYYNQLKGIRINGIFNNGELDYVRAKGNAESVYYLQDVDSAYVGMSYAHADAISMYFQDKALKRVSWVNGVEGTTYPMHQVPDDKKELRNFRWLETRRPKTRLELFE